jgi:hypothetical protein
LWLVLLLPIFIALGVLVTKKTTTDIYVAADTYLGEESFNLNDSFRFGLRLLIGQSPKEPKAFPLSNIAYHWGDRGGTYILYRMKQKELEYGLAKNNDKTALFTIYNVSPEDINNAEKLKKPLDYFKTFRQQKN